MRGQKMAMKRGAQFAGNCLLLLSACLAAGAQGPVVTSPSKAAPKSVSAATFRSNVDLVLVEAGVHDEHGRAIGNLARDDFRILEDGREQVISAFSHEELPLAVALVIDNSSSIVAALQELRAGALDTLALLKRDDEVAIFSFGEKPEMAEALTSNHEALSVDLWALSPNGGTAINDALYDASLYLGHAAPGRRRAVILISDNEASAEQTRTVPDVVRAAEQSGTPIYSVKVGFLRHSRAFFLTHPETRLHDVEKICRLTGGEVIDTSTGVSVSSAMETIITWLKQGYTLGYSPTNKSQDGKFRTIEVRLSNRTEARSRKETIYARQGYYAPAGQ